ncbi:hypothetical protein Naga_100920g1 [Nannochloropsis gaditana]|uniref:Uncharacterized protein n=2 Tax=Nannochloropsis gaditana TaxID=72520 RepID=W7T1E4_9STRA|nr:hypothetical protein Naga_100920g1 [Nannochloropsis gaditana]
MREVLYPTDEPSHSHSVFVLEHLLRSLCDTALLKDSKYFASPIVTKALGGFPGVTLRRYECSGACVVVLDNALEEQGLSVRCRFVLHTGDRSDWGSTHKPAEAPEWRLVGPGHRAIVGVLSSSSQMAQFELEAMGTSGSFVMDRMEVEALSQNQIQCEDVDKAKGIFAWVKI